MNPARTGYRSTALLLACALLWGGATACGPAPSEEASGAVLYQRHCAACHGAEGRGDGPLAASLVEAPADLTRLAERAGGFDETAVLQTIDGRRLVAAHGPRTMPVWGALFEHERGRAGDPLPIYGAILDASALVDYLRSIQVAGEETPP